MRRGAVFSECRRYRYALWRIWDEDIPYAMFICLNPSTADEKKDDPTVRRCVGFARSWGYGGVCVTNLFAYRSTDCRALRRVQDPVGPENDEWLQRLAREVGIIVAAWGNHGSYRGRDREVIGMFPSLSCLELTKRGQPRHPLYLKSDLEPTPLHPERNS